MMRYRKRELLRESWERELDRKIENNLEGELRKREIATHRGRQNERISTRESWKRESVCLRERERVCGGSYSHLFVGFSTTWKALQWTASIKAITSMDHCWLLNTWPKNWIELFKGEKKFPRSGVNNKNWDSAELGFSWKGPGACTIKLYGFLL